MFKYFSLLMLLLLTVAASAQTGQTPTAQDLAAAAKYTEDGNFSAAAAIYEKLADSDPGSITLQLKLADVYLHLERDSEAIAAARKVIAIEPKNEAAYLYSGKIFLELGQTEEAAANFQKAVELNPGDPDAFYFLGLSESRRGRNETAVTNLRKAAAVSPADFKYQFQLGQSLIDAAKYEEAIVPLQKSVSLDPRNFEAKVALGLALFESAKYNEALPLLNEADRMKPGNEVVNMFLNVTRSRQQNAGRLEEMKQFAKENPGDLNVRMHLIQMLGFLRMINEAEPYIEEVRKMNSQDVRVYETIAVVYATAGKMDKAAEMNRKSLEIQESPGAYLGLANYYTKKGQVDEAIKAFNKVLELKPDSPNIIKLYADLLRDSGRKREALEMYKRSLAMLPLNSPALFNAGVLSQKLGDKASALQYLATLKTVDALSAKLLQRFLNLKS